MPSHSEGSKIEVKIEQKRTAFRKYLCSLGWTPAAAMCEVDLWRITGTLRRSGAWANGIDLFYRYHGGLLVAVLTSLNIFPDASFLF